MPVLSFKVSAAEARAIRARARARNRTVSAYLREQALPEKKGPRKRPLLKSHVVSGLTVDATPGPVVTEEEIRASLVDLP
jgi:hypothetical protein